VDTPTASDRARWAEHLGDLALHGRLLAELNCLHEVELKPPIGAPLKGWVRVAAWNAERGRDVPAATSLLRRCGADVLLLTELDWGMERTGNVDVPRALADSLQTGYGFGVEFIELAGEHEDDGDNELGLHGNAILTATQLEQPKVVRLDGEGAWFAADSTEPRVGGRVAVLGTIEVDGTPVRVASTHLENMTDPDGRAAQLSVLLEALEELGPGPAIVGGDLNTFGAPLKDLADRAAVRRMRGDDPARFSWPVAYEPLFETARAHGFEWADANVAAPTTSHDAAGLPDHVPLKLDWILIRGLDARRAAVTSCDGLSDHQVVSAAVRVPAGV
jgi:endonuclease/exonuclease/phosphatase family metal-dependent hydrolase